LTQGTTPVEINAVGPSTQRWWRTGGLVLGWVGFIGIWAFVSRFVLDEFVFPGPAKVGAAMWDIVVSGQFVDDFVASISKTFLGFAIGAVLAVPIGFAMGRSRYWKAFFHDGVVAAGSIPGITYAVLALVVFGTGFLGPVIAVGLISMPFIALSVAEGVEGVDANLISMSVAFHRSSPDIMRQVMLPRSCRSCSPGFDLPSPSPGKWRPSPRCSARPTVSASRSGTHFKHSRSPTSWRGLCSSSH